ncbi:MAG: VCBS repeat-containing protein, partial [Anaerolineales bacterium]
AWTEHTVDGAFNGAISVYAADVDGDGDLDILGAAYYAGDVAWWENTVGDGSAWTEHTVDPAFNGARSVFAADVNGDDDLDVLGAAADADEIAWWENRGGQFAFSTTDTAPPSMNTGTMDDILQIEITHRGRSGDSDLELVTLELLFDGCYGDSCTPANLTSSQANELFDDLRIYKDTGSGVFEGGTDTLVVTVDTLVLTGGVQIVTFSDGDANVQVAYGTSQTYFVVVDRVDSVPGTPTVDRFTIAHITEDSSTAEDRSHDIGLTLEYATNATSSQVVMEGSTNKIYLPIVLRE